MAPKLSKFYGSKRNEKFKILSSYLEARERTKFKKEALQAVADEYGFTFTKVQNVVQRYNPLTSDCTNGTPSLLSKKRGRSGSSLVWPT